MYAERDSAGRRRRLGAGAATAAIHAALAVALIWGLSIEPHPAPDAAPPLATFDLSPPPPPPPPRPQAGHQAAPSPAGEEGPTRAALPREAPTARIPLAETPAATSAAIGAQADAGAGAQGTGSGAGGAGSGEGSGGEGGAASPARKIAGELRDSDYPREAEKARLSGTVGIRLEIASNGQVSGCAVVRSSGHAVFDELTCRLVRERYRFAPATDSRGQAVASSVGMSFTWGTRRRR